MKVVLLFFSVIFFSVMGFAKSVALDINSKTIDSQMKVLNKVYDKPIIIASGVAKKIISVKADPLQKEEAKHILAKALSIEGIAIIEKPTEVSFILAKDALKSGIELLNETDFAVTPERFASLILKVPDGKAADMEKSIRHLYSRDGAVYVAPSGDRLIISDWTSNLIRLQQVIQSLR